MNLIERVQELEGKINEYLKDNKILVKILGNGEKNTGRIVIFKNKKLDRELSFDMISSSQIKISENNKVMEEGLFIDNLVKWFFNLYNSVEYLYTFYGGPLNGKVLERNQVEKIANNITRDYSEEREKGLLVHRKELDKQPTINNYLGPMFEAIDYGKIYLRYETPEIYEMLSH